MSAVPLLFSVSSVSQMNVLATLQHASLGVSLVLCVELPHLLFSAACPVINHSFSEILSVIVRGPSCRH